MSGLTTEFTVKTGENRRKYWVYIDKFDKKVKFFSEGRKIYSKIFKISRSSFQINIQPNSSNSKNFVALWIQNKSNWQVKAVASVGVRDRDFTQKLEPKFFLPCDRSSNTDEKSSTWGTGEFIPHARCNKNDLLMEDGRIAFEVEIELLEEEVPQSVDLEEDLETQMQFCRLP